MIKELISIANELDNRGLIKEADIADEIIDLIKRIKQKVEHDEPDEDAEEHAENEIRKLTEEVEELLRSNNVDSNDKLISDIVNLVETHEHEEGPESEEEMKAEEEILEENND